MEVLENNMEKSELNLEQNSNENLNEEKIIDFDKLEERYKITSQDNTFTEEEKKEISDIRERLGLENKDVESSANYEGDWTLLLRERMLDPITKEKFISVRQQAMTEMKKGEPGFLDKPETFVQHYQDQIDNYEENIEKVFSSTEYGEAGKFNKQPKNLGKGKIGTEGVVFSDAESKGTPLSVRQKNIVESHEKGHGLRDFTSNFDYREFSDAIDKNALRDLEKTDEKRFTNYLSSADEIAERMAQLKNYFGFKASDVMTKEHLRYAKENYVKDTGLDNLMTEFFSAIPPEKEEKFLEVLNKYPL